MYNPGQEISSIDFGAIIGGSLNAVVKAQSQSAQTTVDFIKSVGFQKKIEKDENGNIVETDVPINVAFSYDKEVSPSQVLAQQGYTVVIDSKNSGSGYSQENIANYKLMAGKSELPVESIEIGASGKVTKINLGEMPKDVEYADGTELALVYVGKEKEKAPVKEAKLTLKVSTTYENVPAVIQKMQIQVPILTMVPIPFIKIDSAEIDFNVKINSVSTESSESKNETKTNSDVKNEIYKRARRHNSQCNIRKLQAKYCIYMNYCLRFEQYTDKKCSI